MSARQTSSFGVFAAAGALAFGGVASGAWTMQADAECCSKKKVDYDAVRTAIADMLEKEDYDDGSLGPFFVRLGWHAAGTFSCKDGSGGSCGGATMRFSPESQWGANAGLLKAQAFLEPIKKQFPGISYADLWSLAATVAIEEMGGPKCDWRAGRTDAADNSNTVEDGRLPDATQGSQHLRDIFYRMGFNDREIVALSGAHSIGRCHGDRSGFKGPWTRAPTAFSNLYFIELVENTWTQKPGSDPMQYEDPTGELMMLPTDMALMDDAKFRPIVQEYAKDEALFFKDFASAWSKLQHNGMKCPAKKSSGITGNVLGLGLAAASLFLR